MNKEILNKEMPLISVVIPIYNVREYLYQCISSVCTQTYPKLQIILVDDGSTDGCSFICDAFADKDHRIEVLHKKNGGLVSARKAGIERAEGEYISFVDGDDWIDEDTYEKIVGLGYGRRPDVFAYGCVEEYPSYKKYKKNSVRAGLYSGKELEQLKGSILMGESFFEWAVLPHLCDKLIKRQLIVECIGRVPDTVSFAEDAVCSFPCMLKAESILFLDITPYHYRQREGSIVRETGELEKERFIEIYGLLKKSFCEVMGLDIQLKYYMFFLLCLKGYSKLDGEMALFPFERVGFGDRIFVYGAGGFGRVVKTYVEQSDSLSLCGWTDKRADHYIEQGMNLDRYHSIFDKDYDRLVVSILDENICREAKRELISKGVAGDKIDFVGKEAIARAKLPDWLEWEYSS